VEVTDFERPRSFRPSASWLILESVFSRLP
jgi:hypothetical protein